MAPVAQPTPTVQAENAVVEPMITALAPGNPHIVQTNVIEPAIAQAMNGVYLQR